MPEIFKGKTYALTESQIRDLANIAYREQGDGEAGVRACVSHMLNYYEKYQTKKYSNPYDCTLKSGWYGTYSFNQSYIGKTLAPQSVINYVRDVIISGNRSIPSYVDEYDCLSDVKTAKNNGVSFNPKDRSQYKKDVTKVTNVYGSTWTFYCFPDGASGVTDAFGYISKPTNSTQKPVSSGTTTTTTNTSSIIEKAVKWALNIAADQSHGYSQADRWGPNYDCSSMVISAYKQAGVAIDINQVYYTGNMNGLKNYGFKDVTNSVNLNTGAGLQRGDVLYYHIKDTNGHTAMFIGNGQIVHARGQSYGSPASGDQGTEIAVTNYSRSQWQYVLRYGGGATTSASTTTATVTTAPQTEWQYGDVNSKVKEIQQMLNKIGYHLVEDGEFGEKTYDAVMDFQARYNLEVDGVVGKNTLAKLNELVKKTAAKPTTTTTTTATVKPQTSSTVVNKQKADGSYTVGKTVQYKAKAIDNNLNVRSGPGYGYDNIKTYPRLEKGQVIEVCDKVTALDGSLWCYIRINGNVYGFVAAQYIVKV